MMSIRQAAAADARAIAEVHVASWRSTYSGLIPDEVLAGLEVAPREASWRRGIEAAAQDPSRGVVLVATDDAGLVVGFANGGPEREPGAPFDGELYAIYLLESQQGMGTGRLLVRRVVEHFQSQGYQSMRVWVLDGNPAMAFYERLGGRQSGTKGIQIGGSSFKEVSYAWDDLSNFH